MNKNYFENDGYEVYFEGDKFTYQNANRVVQSNEFMIAIKDNKEKDEENERKDIKTKYQKIRHK